LTDQKEYRCPECDSYNVVVSYDAVVEVYPDGREDVMYGKDDLTGFHCHDCCFAGVDILDWSPEKEASK